MVMGQPPHPDDIDETEEDDDDEEEEEEEEGTEAPAAAAEDDDDDDDDVDDDDDDIATAPTAPTAEEEMINSEEDEEEDIDEGEEEEASETAAAPASRKRKKRKNINFNSEPRMGMMGFFVYCKYNKPRAMSELKTDLFGKAVQLLIKEYNDLTDEQLLLWEERALEMNVQKEEMKRFEDDGPTTQKTKKDPLAPKRHKSAFLIFSMENRERIAREHPGASFGEIAKLISKSFHDLSTDKQKIWHDKAAEDKARYQKEMKGYENEQQKQQAAAAAAQAQQKQPDDHHSGGAETPMEEV